MADIGHDDMSGYFTLAAGILYLIEAATQFSAGKIPEGVMMGCYFTANVMLWLILAR